MTLRRSLVLVLAGLTAAGLLIVSSTAVLALRAYLFKQTDDQLTAAAQLAQARSAVLLMDPKQRSAAVQQFIAVTEYVIEIRSPSTGTIRMVGAATLPAKPLLDQAKLDDTDPQTVAGYRAVVVRSDQRTVLVAVSLDPLHATIRRLLLVAALTSLLVLVLLAFGARFLVIRRLRPLNEIAAAATDLAEGHLDRRVPAPHGTRTEVGQLTTAINGMLARIQAAITQRERSEQRMREFVADASHELRTPLTAMQGYLQLVRTGVVDLRERPDVLRRLDQEATRMGSMVGSLLYLARLDAEPPARRDPVDLAALVRDAVADAAAVDPARTVTAETPDECTVTGDEDTLRQVLANLLANVRAHTDPGTPAVIVIATGQDRVRVSVTDEGPGFDANAGTHAFDRFWRAGSARSAADGAGLGLAIVAEVIRAHGGEVGIDGSTVWFTLPYSGV